MQTGHIVKSQPAASPGTSPAASPAASFYLLRFDSLFHAGRGLAFPCDAAGHVDLDSMSERARNSYFYARTVVGREYSSPAVRADWVH